MAMVVGAVVVGADGYRCRCSGAAPDIGAVVVGTTVPL